MSLPFKYICKFSESVVASSPKSEQIESLASVESLRDLIPEDIDFGKNIDLVGVAFNGAVANMFNKNGDGIDTETAIAIKDYFIHKPTNIEHQRKKVVGHVVGASFSKYGTNELMSEEEAAASDEPFNIALSSVVYKTVNPEFAELVQKSVDEEDELYQKVSASWEIGFNDYVIAVGSDNLKDAKIIEDEEGKEENKQFLKAYGGNGRNDDGEEVHRLIVGDVYPLGIGFTANPAAAVKGLTVDEKSIREFKLKDSGESSSYEKIEIKKIKSSHLHKHDVNLSKNLKPNIIMEQEILNQVKETLEAQASSKKLSEEAIANITKVFHDAIIQKNDQWQADKEEMGKANEELVQASEESKKTIESLKEEIAAMNQQVELLKTEAAAKEASEKFNDRMSALDDLFELEDEDRIVLASDLKSLDSTEEAYAEYKEKLSVMWKHKTKSFKEEQQKAIAAKVEEQVQKRISELSSASESTEEVAEESTEEVVEEAIENAEIEEEVVANNNGDATQDQLTLREKFKQAFSKDNVNIQY
jgi:phage shock protein A